MVVVMMIHQRTVLSATMSFMSRNGSPTGELGITVTIKYAHLLFSGIWSVSLSLYQIELPGVLTTCPLVGKRTW